VRILAVILLALQMHNPVVPVVIGRGDNCIVEFSVPEGSSLGEVRLRYDGIPARAVREVCLVKDGVVVRKGTRLHRTLALKGEPLGGGDYSIRVGLAQFKPKDLSKPFMMGVSSVVIDGRRETPSQDGTTKRRLGVEVAKSGDGVAAYRIPGIATSNKGTLVSVFDIRRDKTSDLQGDIDIGLRRSHDGGVSWSEVSVAMDMGQWGGLPQDQNGIGDPAILVDEATGDLFICALWMHGFPGKMAWWASSDGLSPTQTGQIMISRSSDDGLTWSDPVNITSQVKDPSWLLSLQGPGRGISMSDGALVFAFQHQEGEKRLPYSGIIYSKDHGVTWHAGETCPLPNTTEAQVAEVSEGVLMLNMRNNARTGRAVYTTSDLGKTWKEHPSNLQIQEPVCMASLYGKPDGVMLFSNPDSKKGRVNMTLKGSLDGGMSWPYSVLLYEKEGWGYSCITMIDDATVGILYEERQGSLVFQAVKLSELLGGR